MALHSWQYILLNGCINQLVFQASLGACVFGTKVTMRVLLWLRSWLPTDSPHTNNMKWYSPETFIGRNSSNCDNTSKWSPRKLHFQLWPLCQSHLTSQHCSCELAVVPFNSFPVRLPNDDVSKATDSRESWEMKENSICNYPVIATCGHSGYSILFQRLFYPDNENGNLFIYYISQLVIFKNITHLHKNTGYLLF